MGGWHSMGNDQLILDLAEEADRAAARFYALLIETEDPVLAAAIKTRVKALQAQAGEGAR